MNDSPPLFNEVAVEKCKSSSLQVFAFVKVASQERPKQRYKISIIVLKTLRQTASLRVKPCSLNKQRIFLRLKFGIKHHSIHDIIQHQLKTFSDNNPFTSNNLISLKILHYQIHFLFPHVAIIMNNFVSEKRQCHDSSHFTPVITVDCENHVLSITGEDIEDDVTRTRAEFDTL